MEESALQEPMPGAQHHLHVADRAVIVEDALEVILEDLVAHLEDDGLAGFDVAAAHHFDQDGQRQVEEDAAGD